MKTYGASPVEQAREAIGLAVARERFGQRFYSNLSAVVGVFPVARIGRLSVSFCRRPCWRLSRHVTSGWRSWQLAWFRLYLHAAVEKVLARCYHRYQKTGFPKFSLNDWLVLAAKTLLSAPASPFMVGANLATTALLATKKAVPVKATRQRPASTEKVPLSETLKRMRREQST